MDVGSSQKSCRYGRLQSAVRRSDVPRSKYGAGLDKACQAVEAGEGGPLFSASDESAYEERVPSLGTTRLFDYSGALSCTPKSSVAGAGVQCSIAGVRQGDIDFGLDLTDATPQSSSSSTALSVRTSTPSVTRSPRAAKCFDGSIPAPSPLLSPSLVSSTSWTVFETPYSVEHLCATGSFCSKALHHK